MINNLQLSETNSQEKVSGS